MRRRALLIKVLSNDTEIYDFTYTGDVQSRSFSPGIYKLEVWGAQGGSYNTTYGGKGGYSVGEVTLTEETTLYVYVGGQGSSNTTNGRNTGGFNGGGAGYSTSNTALGEAGGGASDVRIGTDSLYARVIVAGGGGGVGYYERANAGGSGGGTSGESGTTFKSNYGNTYNGGTGGSQTTRGTSYYGTTSNRTTYGTLAAFGVGGGAISNTTNYQITGGGGGWYGGGYSRRGGGGGGSGYVYNSSTASNYPSGCLLDSSYYLSNSSTTAGNASMPKVDGTGNETGHSGNGYVRITCLEKFEVNNFEYTGDVQSKTLSAGTYVIECWGAQGGTNGSYTGGNGGYSIGNLTLTSNTTVYVYVGGQGQAVLATGSTLAGGFNGGGACRTGSNSYPVGSGGGASDVRIGTDSLYARVIVAGGGGGFGYQQNGGAGGGETGQQAPNSGGAGGTQTTAGSANRNNNAAVAEFGTGGGSNGTATLGYMMPGGGGGWYGGAHHSVNSESNIRGGGGGSGYVYNSSTASNYPSGCLLDSSYYLSNFSTSDGTNNNPSINNGVETGHEGNGYVRISRIS